MAKEREFSQTLAATSPKAASQARLAEARRVQNEKEITWVKATLAEAHGRTLLCLKQKLDLAEEEARSAAKREARRQSRQRQTKAATVIQRVVRGGRARRNFWDELLRHHREKKLQEEKKELQEHLTSLCQTLHELKHTNKDREMAAVHIQACWRGLVGRRLAGLLRMLAHFFRAQDLLSEAASRIQALHRGHSARRRVKVLKQWQLDRDDEEKTLTEQKLKNAAHRIVASFRYAKAQQEVTKRKADIIAHHGDLDGIAIPSASKTPPGRSAHRGLRLMPQLRPPRVGLPELRRR